MVDQGPFRYTMCTADQTIFPKAAWVHSYTVQNKSAGAVDITLYDDAAGGTTNPCEQVTLAAGASMGIYTNFQTLNGLGIKASAWPSVAVSVKWAAR